MMDFRCPYCGFNITYKVQLHIGSLRELRKEKGGKPAICNGLACTHCYKTIQYTLNEGECFQCGNNLNCLGKGLIHFPSFLFDDQFFYKWISSNAIAVK